MSGRPCASPSCCTAACNPYVCSAPAPVLTLNWGQAAFAATQNAVVGITDGSGVALGSGFWITGRAVVTSWQAVWRQALGLRVAVFQPLGTGPPLALDAVLVYAIPTLDLAFLVVNPLTLQGMLLAPPLLSLAFDAAAGQDVFMLANVGNTQNVTIATGTVMDPSFALTGYVTQLLTSIFTFLAGTFGDGTREACRGTLGAPILRATDYAVVGINQRTGFTAGDFSAGGLDALTLNAGVRWALLNSTLLSAPYLLGAGTGLTVQRALALSVKVYSELQSDTPGVIIPYAYVPLSAVGATTEPTALELGVPATGALVADPVPFDPTFATPDNEGFQLSLNLLRTVTATVATPNPVVPMDVGYIRRTLPANTVWNEIGVLPNVLPVDGEADYATLALPVADPANLFRISATSGAGGSFVDELWCTAITVSPMGIIGFATEAVPAFEMTVASAENIIADPIGQNAGTYWAAPFASLDFAPYEDGTFPLTMYATFVDGTVTIQWTGVSRSGVPVSFQAHLTYGPVKLAGDAPNPWPGQVTFAYPPDRMLPGWPGDLWVTGTALTVPPPAGFTSFPAQVMLVPQLPVKNDVIYFGLASSSSTVTLTATNAVGTTPPYIIGGRGGITTTTVLPTVLQGTVVAVNTAATGDEPYFQYGLYRADVSTALSSVQVIGSLGTSTSTVGQAALSQASLGDVIATAGLLSSGTVAIPVVPLWRTTQFSTPVTLTTAQTAQLLGSAQFLGDVSSSSTALTTTSYSFVPGTSAYGGVVCSVPMSYIASTSTTEPLQAELLSVSGSFTASIPSAPGTNAPTVFILSLANTNSTTLSDEFITSTTSVSVTGLYTTVYLVVDTVAGTTTATVYYSNGYNNTGSRVTGASSVLTTFPATVAVPFTLSYAPAAYVARINALVLGRPPADGFTNDWGSDPLVPMPAVVTLTTVSTAFRNTTFVADLDNQYAVTRGFRDTLVAGLLPNPF